MTLSQDQTEGQLIALGRCWACKAPFTFNPYTVPSLPVDPETNFPPDLCTCGDFDACKARAIRRPICMTCDDLRKIGRPRIVLSYAGRVAAGNDPQAAYRQVRQLAALKPVRDYIHRLALDVEGRRFLQEAGNQWRTYGFVPPWEEETRG